MNFFICHERVTKSPTGNEPMAFQIPVGRSSTELRKTLGELGVLQLLGTAMPKASNKRAE